MLDFLKYLYNICTTNIYLAVSFIVCFIEFKSECTVENSYKHEIVLSVIGYCDVLYPRSSPSGKLSPGEQILHHHVKEPNQEEILVINHGTVSLR